MCFLAAAQTLRGKVPSGGNFNCHGLKWKKPFRSILSFVSRPSDDPTISLDVSLLHASAASDALVLCTPSMLAALVSL